MCENRVSEKCPNLIGTGVGRRARHRVVMGKTINAYRILVVKHERKGLTEKPRRRWENGRQNRRRKISKLWRWNWLRILSNCMLFINKDKWSIFLPHNWTFVSVLFMSSSFHSIYSFVYSFIQSFYHSFVNNSEKYLALNDRSSSNKLERMLFWDVALCTVLLERKLSLG
jgi:hypothetical protein